MAYNQDLYDLINGSCLNLDYLRFELDYAMWLAIKYDGEPETTPVSLIREPRSALNRVIREYMAGHRDEPARSSAYLRCSKCGREKGIVYSSTSCDARSGADGSPCNGEMVEVVKSDEERLVVSLTTQGLRPRSQRLPGKCYVHDCDSNAEHSHGGIEVCAEHLRRAHESMERQFHELAKFALARQGAIESRVYTVSQWITRKISPRSTLQDELQLPLVEVRRALVERMEKKVDELNYELGKDARIIHPDVRRNMLPRGRTLEERYADWIARCPAHDDRTPSLSIHEGDDGRALVHCHSNKGCTTEKIVAALRLTMRDLMPDDGRFTTERPHRRSNRPKSPPERTRKAGQSFANAKDAIAALERQHGPSLQSWSYHNADGEHVCEVVRWDLPNGSKDYRPVCRTGSSWTIKGMPTPRLLYRLPELAAAKVVFICEGEKAAEGPRQSGRHRLADAGQGQAQTPRCRRPRRIPRAVGLATARAC